MRCLFFLLAVALLLAEALLHGAVTVHEDGLIFHVANDFESLPAEPLAAWGTWDDSINSTGWAKLVIHSNESMPNEVQARSAGYLEGALTAERTYEYIMNTQGGSSGFTPALEQFVVANTEWVHQQVAANQDSIYWHQVGLLYEQFSGMWEGYQHSVSTSKQFNWTTFYAATLTGDLDDLCTVFGCTGSSSGLAGVGHCSVLLKPFANDLFLAHTTWGRFNTMTRIYKHYDFPYRSHPQSPGIVPGRHITFSSYPAVLFSDDDFYQTSAGLAIVETTINNRNATLWKRITPESVLIWVRVMLANRLTAEIMGWADMFSKFNSGTYNNEWMVVDYKKYTPSKPLPKGTFLVLEQMPGLIKYQDMSAWVNAKGYWASYNRPYFPEIFDISAQEEALKKYGPHYSWNLTARAQIFARLQGSVTSEKEFQALMRYNDFQHDPMGMQACKHGPSASNAIAERGDLTPLTSDCIPDIAQQNEAGIDVKYTSRAMTMTPGRLTNVAQSGPTYDAQPPFVWSTSPFAAIPHQGLPDKWEFPWVTMTWDTSSP